MAERGERSFDDIEEGPPCSVSDVSDEGSSICYYDAEDSSLHSQNDSNDVHSSHCDTQFSGASSHESGDIQEPSRKSFVYEEIELGNGAFEIKVVKSESDRDCRICYLTLEKAALDSGIPISLGCSCKGDLAAVHKQCAETWFKTKGDTVCEICGSTARNVVDFFQLELKEQSSEDNASTTPLPSPAQTQRFWQGHRVLNFLLVCLVLAFVVSWLFHFNVAG